MFYKHLLLFYVLSTMVFLFLSLASILHVKAYQYIILILFEENK